MTRWTAAIAAPLATWAAAVAVASPPPPAQRPAIRVAVLADPTASPADVAAAAAGVRGPVAEVDVRRVSGGPEARAAALALAADGYDVITPAGPWARAAVQEARAAGVAGAGATR